MTQKPNSKPIIPTNWIAYLKKKDPIAAFNYEFAELYGKLSPDNYKKIRTQLLRQITTQNFKPTLPNKVAVFFKLLPKEKEYYQQCHKLGLDIFFIDQLLYAFGFAYEQAIETEQKMQTTRYKAVRQYKIDEEYLLNYCLINRACNEVGFHTAVLKELERRREEYSWTEIHKAEIQEEFGTQDSEVRAAINGALPSPDYFKRQKNTYDRIKTKPIYHYSYGLTLQSNVKYFGTYSDSLTLKQFQCIRNQLIMILVEYFRSVGAPNYLLIYKLLSLHEMAETGKKQRKDKKRNDSNQPASYTKAGKKIKDAFNQIVSGESAGPKRLLQISQQTFSGVFDVEALPLDLDDK